MCQSTDKSGKPTKPGTSQIAVWFKDVPSWSYSLYALLKDTPAITDPGRYVLCVFSKLRKPIGSKILEEDKNIISELD